MRILGRDSGVAHIWVAIVLPMMVGFVGLAIDMGYETWVGQQLQSCADASALAGAYYVQTNVDEARAAAVRIALLNRAADGPMQLNLNTENAPEGDIVVGRFDRDTMTFNPASLTPNAVQVRAKRTPDSLSGPVPLLFGPALHVNVASLKRSAIAMVGGGTGAGLLVLDEHGDGALSISGNATINVNDGAIQVNSDSDSGAKVWGSVTVNAEELNVVGECDSRVELPFPINDGAPKLEDPLAFLPDPTWDPTADLGSVTGTPTVTITAGYYSGGIDVTGGHLTMSPGIYILGGAGMRIRGNAALTAEGVMLYIVSPGCLDLAGTGDRHRRHGRHPVWKPIDCKQGGHFGYRHRDDQLRRAIPRARQPRLSGAVGYSLLRSRKPIAATTTQIAGMAANQNERRGGAPGCCGAGR
ncbi:MAG: pilus assembly protein TadG-related protein [Candidatus Hydrogenedentes bacterium]|nr:pilus assembly protein TadG-related protein [Candidatus Hydrogenedentota bacterium]